MAKGLYACKNCGNDVPTDETYTYSGKKYCKSCYDKKTDERQDYESLIKRICDYFLIDVPNGMILRQIKKIKEEFNYTDAGIDYTLWYCKEVKGMNLEIKYGIGIVKFEYQNAKDYFMQQLKISESVQAIGKVEEKIREVTVSLKKPVHRKELLIDIDSLIGEGDS